MLVLVVLVTGMTLAALVQHAQARRTMALRLRRAEVETEAAMLLGLEEAMRLLSEHTLAFPEDPLPPEVNPEGMTADSGARIWLAFADAQDRFDLQWLKNRGVPQESFGHLFRAAELRGNLLALEEWAEAPEDLVTVDEWGLHVPEAAVWMTTPLRGDVRVLPVPVSGVTPLNVNAVEGERFLRMMGDGLRGWSETVLRLREVEPLRDLGGMLALLPGPVASALEPYLGVRSDFFEVRLEVEYDAVVKEGWALVQRSGNGVVEVMQCRW